MERAIFTSPVVPMVNRLAVALLDTPVLGPIVAPRPDQDSLCRSAIGQDDPDAGRLPAIRRRDRHRCHAAPDAKTWWRNFLGEGGPDQSCSSSTVEDRTGHAVADRDDKGRVKVTVALS